MGKDVSGEPLYLAIYRRLVALIVSGHWQAGERLPSSRKLAESSGVSRTTAQLAIDRLIADGWAHARPRSGVFVTPMAAPPPPDGDARRERVSILPLPFELSQGAVDCFPHARWSRLQSKVWSSTVPTALYEPEIAGDVALRASIARHLAITRGIQPAIDDVFILPSTKAALLLAARIVGGQDKSALVEDPGYLDGSAALAAGDLAPVAVGVDRKGIRLDPGDPSHEGASLLYATPAAQFPTGVILSPDRRQLIEAWASEGDRYVFEDDYDWEANFDADRTPAPLKSGSLFDRTFYCQSFSRILFSSFRLTVLVVPPALREGATAAQSILEAAPNVPSQLVLREFIDSGSLAAHLRELRAIYRERRAALLSMVEPYLGGTFADGVNPAGLRLVLRCTAKRAARIAECLRDEGILCSTLSQLSRSGVADDGIVLGFAAFPVDRIKAQRAAFDRAMAAAGAG